GALVDLEAVGVELAQAVFAPGRAPVQAGGDPLVPSGGVGGRLSRSLRGDCFLTPIEAQPGVAAHRLTENGGAQRREAHVATVRLTPHRDEELHAETGDEERLRIPVIDEGVDEPDPVRTGKQVEAEREWQPSLVTATMGPSHLDNGTHGPFLLDGDGVDH